VCNETKPEIRLVRKVACKVIEAKIPTLLGRIGVEQTDLHSSSAVRPLRIANNTWKL
jgi:hypothetical protein